MKNISFTRISRSEFHKKLIEDVRAKLPKIDARSYGNIESGRSYKIEFGLNGKSVLVLVNEDDCFIGNKLFRFEPQSIHALVQMTVKELESPVN